MFDDWDRRIFEMVDGWDRWIFDLVMLAVVLIALLFVIASYETKFPGDEE